jgi:hypothetical protein
MLLPRALLLMLVCALVAGAVSPPVGFAQDAAPGTPGYRQIVEGVFKTIPADIRPEETSATHDVIELLMNQPNRGWKPKQFPASMTLERMATGTTFRRTIWGLDFTFKAPRMIWVDIPQASGKMQRKLIWYLLYKVRNPGGQLANVVQPDGTYTIEKVNEPVLFEPHFVLESLEYKKAYLDRLIPVAVDAIRKREDPRRVLLNSVQMGAKPIPVSPPDSDLSVWGVATWEDVDPRIDYFSIYVQGLSNAYKWADPAGAYKKGDPPGTGRVFAYKTLRLNFWRPGDDLVEDESVIKFGIPGKLDHEWVYR